MIHKCLSYYNLSCWNRHKKLCAQQYFFYFLVFSVKRKIMASKSDTGKFFKELSKEGTPYAKITVVGVGQVGMAAAYCMMLQVNIGTIYKTMYFVDNDNHVVIMPTHQWGWTYYFCFVRCRTSFPLILRKSIRAIFTKFGMQDYLDSVLLGIAFSCCSSFAY